MKVKSQERWGGILRDNSGGYQRIILEFAEQWADRMEAGLLPGKRVEEVADLALAETGKKPTRLQLAQAVIALVEVWEYGDALRRWYKDRMWEVRAREGS